MTLRDVLSRARDGDDAAQDELFGRFYPPVRRAVHRQLQLDVRRKRPWLAALFSTGDVVQDVFIAVLRDLEGFASDDERAFELFLAKTVSHRLLDVIRFHEAAQRDGRRVGRDLDLAALLPGDGASPGTAAADGEEREILHDAMAGLTARDRMLLEMRFRGGATFGRIAEALGYNTEDAVRKAVRAAEARILVALRVRGFKR